MSTKKHSYFFSCLFWSLFYVNKEGCVLKVVSAFPGYNTIQYISLSRSHQNNTASVARAPELKGHSNLTVNLFMHLQLVSTSPTADQTGLYPPPRPYFDDRDFHRCYVFCEDLRVIVNANTKKKPVRRSINRNSTMDTRPKHTMNLALRRRHVRHQRVHSTGD